MKHKNPIININNDIIGQFLTASNFKMRLTLLTIS